MGNLIQDLLIPGGEVIETHISWVLLQGLNVFKLKKPVSLGFLDFGTAEKRREACLAEVRLNRRLAPKVYRACVPVTLDSQGHHRVGGEGKAVDWAVHMVRLPESERADIRLSEGRLEAGHLEQIANKLAVFHAEARCDEETSHYGKLETITANVRENFDQTRDTIDDYINPEQAAEIEAWQRSYLRAHTELIEARRRAGRVRDGHGDLRLEHVYLSGADEIVIIDCIEFNNRFRFADICADIAFLAMDLTWHGRPDLAERFLALYARSANDYDLYLLVDFYESYRAFVRGKIAALVAADPQATAVSRKRAGRDARRYFLLALASERRALVPPRLIAIGGTIASGKSTISEALAVEMAAPLVDSDRTRKSLLGVAPTEPLHDPAWHGAYSAEQTQRVYAEVMHRATAVLSTGRSVILDASFRSVEERAAAIALARRFEIPFLFVECRAPVALCRERLQIRASTSSISDGRLELLDELAASWQSADEIPEAQHLVLETALPVEMNLKITLERLGLEALKARS